MVLAVEVGPVLVVGGDCGVEGVEKMNVAFPRRCGGKYLLTVSVAEAVVYTNGLR